MNKFFLLSTIVLFLSSSCATTKGVNAEVVRDCSGVYVRVVNDDYYVCNKSVLENVDAGVQIRVQLKKVKPECCEAKKDIVCMLYHEHRGIVKVKLMQN